MAYAKEITRKYLEQLGITYVSNDGNKVICKGKEMTIKLNNSGNNILRLYDSDYYKTIPIERRCKSYKNRKSGNISISMSRVVYAWYNGAVKSGMLVGHLDNDRSNNALSNLILTSSRQNVTKNKPVKYKRTRLTQKELLKRLKEVDEKYQQCKENKDTEGAHIYRGYRASYVRRLRYFNNKLRQMRG